MVYMYGGLVGNNITDELWQYDITENNWAMVKTASGVGSSTMVPPLAVVGHTSHVIGEVMYVIFGHSPIYGYMNTVQEFNMCK